MKLAFISLCGFRGYRKPLRVDFADAFTIIDGRNGVGKSTLFDAVEFALTGTISKYSEAKASGESVADYFWWTGSGPAPAERYVEVGFKDRDGAIVPIRRTQFETPSVAILKELTQKLCDSKVAPVTPLMQLCASTIIRDEHITSLSLDLKETERYALLRDALGANDGEKWVERGAQLVALAKRQSVAAQQEVNAANNDLAIVTRRLDEIRANVVTDKVVSDVVARLHAFSGSVDAADQLAGPVSERIAQQEARIEQLRKLADLFTQTDQSRERLPAASIELSAAEARRNQATLQLQERSAILDRTSVSVSDVAHKMMSLVELGRSVGLLDGHCPLCNQQQSDEVFSSGLDSSVEIARKLSAAAVQFAEAEQARKTAEVELQAATTALVRLQAEHAEATRITTEFEKLRSDLKFPAASTREAVLEDIATIFHSLEAARKDLRVLASVRLNEELERNLKAEADIKSRWTRAQERLGRTRKAETVAQALHDAARRAVGETLDQRLERVLPLMSELYRRLRPHPVWCDIEYSIRGDVKRFLKLQVGDDLNPQFLFSSGQRRATGLAFLLSVNLSLKWSKWETVMLDDPVQHVDDFRTVHLAEVAAKLVDAGRQVICAVEDAALADLLCRRLPFTQIGEAKRITLGPDSDGALAISADRELNPLPTNVLFEPSTQVMAS